MRKSQYLYLGDKIGRKVYYAIEEEKLYWGNGGQNGLLTSLIAFIGIVFYAFTKNLKFSELHYNETAYVICSAIVGLLLSVICQQYGIKSGEKYFSGAESTEDIPREQMVKILQQARRFTMVYHIFRIVLGMILLFTPFLIREVKSIVVFCSYFIVWFAFGVLMQMNLRKRRKVLRKIREQYLQ